MDNATTQTRLNLPARVGAWWARRREGGRVQALQRRCPPATVAVGQIPPTVRAAWVRHAPAEFPGLAVDDAAWLRCALGLAQFFEACRLQQEQGACALPSKAADSVWHAWLHADPAGLAEWQRRFFDRVVEHREADALGAPLDACLARTWVGACRSEGLSPLGPRLPLLFALDALLRLPTGWAYRHVGGRLVHCGIDGFGKPAGRSVAHLAVAASGLLALGLVSEAELASLRRQAAAGGSSCGGAAAVDGGCADGSSGCSCGGSGCGGGGS